MKEAIIFIETQTFLNKQTRKKYMFEWNQQSKHILQVPRLK